MRPLNKHFEKVRVSLLAKGEEVGIARHGTILGTARELIISDFLAANLPRGFDFVTGEILSAQDTRSGQVDVLILPHTAPRLQISGQVSLALVHAVAAAVEVKSVLTTSEPGLRSELTNAVNTSSKIKSLPILPLLDPWPWSAYITGEQKFVKLPHIPVCLIAFQGPQLNTLMDHLISWEKKIELRKFPNTITCLREGYTLSSK